MIMVHLFDESLCKRKLSHDCMKVCRKLSIKLKLYNRIEKYEQPAKL